MTMLASSGLSPSSFFPWVKKGFLKLRFATMVGVLVNTCLILVDFTGKAMAVPTADDLLKALPLSDSERENVLQGEIVRFTTEEGSDRELAMGAVLLVKNIPENLVPLFREAVVFKLVGGGYCIWRDF